MKYYITNGRGEWTIETERDLMEMVSEAEASSQAFISVMRNGKAEWIIGLDFLKNCIIRPVNQKDSDKVGFFIR